MDAGELVIAIRADASMLESGLREAQKALSSLDTALTRKGSRAFHEMIAGATGFAAGLKRANAEQRGLEALAGTLAGIERETAALQRQLEQNGLAALPDTLRDGASAASYITDRLRALGDSAATGGAEMQLFGQSTDAAMDSAKQQLQAGVLQTMALQNSVGALAGLLARLPAGSIRLDTSAAQNNLTALAGQYNAMAGLLGMQTVSMSRGGGGGGRSRFQKDIVAMEHLQRLEQMNYEQEVAHLLELQKKYTNKRGRSTLSQTDQRDLEERLFAAQEQLRRANYEADRDAYQHRADMGEMTVEQEIAALEQIKTAHQLTQDELWEIDEQLYSLREQAREENTRAAEEAARQQAETVENVYDQVTDALRARYDEERSLEQRALQDKLDALGREQAASDEQRARQSYEDELAELEREMRTERSARKRRELQDQMDDLMEGENQRLADEDLAQRQDAIRAEMDAVDAKYDALIDEENLRQEALRLCMSENLDEATALIAGYGDQWRDAGQALAEALTNGVLDNSAGILSALTDFQTRWNENMTERLQHVALKAGDVLPLDQAVHISVSEMVVREEADIERIAQALREQMESARRG